MGRKPLPPGTWIAPGEVYSITEVGKRMSQSNANVGVAIRNGLRSFQWGNNKYIKGSDLIEWIQQQSTESRNGSQGSP